MGLLKEKYTLLNIIFGTRIKVSSLALNVQKINILPSGTLEYDVISATFPKALIFHDFDSILQHKKWR